MVFFINPMITGKKKKKKKKKKDINECSVGSDNCDSKATCLNTVGSFTCICNSGYFGDGITCSGFFLFPFLLRYSN